MARYEEVAVDLERRIRDGEWTTGETLPTTTALMEHYGNSKETIRAAVDELAKKGLVRVIKRRGSVVQDLTVQRRRIRRNTLVMRDPQRGYIFPAASSAGEPWEVHGQPRRAFTPIPDEVAEHLGVEPGIEVMRRRRVTSPAGEPPFQIVDAWIHPEALTEAPQAGEISTGPGGYLDRIEEAGHGPLSWEEVTRTRMPSKEEAKLLAISPSTPVLEMATIGISSRTDRAVEVSVRVIPGDRAEILSKLERADSAAWPVEPVQA
ncbi:GntR family transcriptional regulator [Streptomyces niveus]|uniref:GntR family transcriptional regulator n=1 Tax=Streptomyces niveus TaxID=193462 RepID=UPI00099FCF08|nr:GntR family transcriptional regulator [Streptomyces niveus]